MAHASAARDGELRWQRCPFERLTARQLHAIVMLREQVFVVEQRCAFQDSDEADLASDHLWAERRDGTVVAYLRVVPAGVKFGETSIGRVVTAPSVRGTGVGRELMRRGIAAVGEDKPIRIGAQAYLERFYREFGFKRVSDLYDEDGIPHIEMLRAPRGVR